MRNGPFTREMRIKKYSIHDNNFNPQISCCTPLPFSINGTVVNSLKLGRY